LDRTHRYRSPAIPTRPSHPAPRFVTIAKRLSNERGMASLNHNFRLSERTIFLRSELDSSGKAGSGFSCFARRVAAATLVVSPPTAAYGVQMARQDITGPSESRQALTPAQAFDMAVALHRESRLGEAAKLYHAILKLSP